MKKVFGVCLAVVFILTLSLGSSHAIWLPDGTKLCGNHFQFSLIGHPNNISGDDSNGRAIMIPLKTTNGDPLVCEDFADGVVVTNDTEPTFYNAEPNNGAKLVFTPADDFAIVDRDGTDGYAEIEIPTVADPEGDNELDRVLAVDVYLRVLGKPNQCMRINGYAKDETQQQDLWFWSGRVELKRKAGQSVFVKVNDLFDVWWCEVDFDDVDGDGVTEECVAGTEEELSVFDSTFAEYFWDMENNGVRNVQVRLYPVTPHPCQPE